MMSGLPGVRIATPPKSPACPGVPRADSLTTLAFVHELDWIFDGKDMVITVVIDEVDHRSSVVDLPEPVGPVTSTKPRGNMEMSRNTWPMPRCPSTAPPRNRSEDRARTAILIEGIDAKARDTRHLEGKVSPELFKILPLSVVHDVVDQRLNAGMVLSGTSMRRTSPSTRIIGGRPAER